MEKLKQKLSGIILIIISVVPMMLEHDATVAFVLIPLGLYLIVTKEQVMQF